MFIDTRAIDFPLTDAIRRHVESRVGAALAPVARRVRGVTARLEDVNADRGGVDKRCRLVAALRHGGIVVVESVAADLYAAVGDAAKRARRAVLRAVARPHARDRKDPQRPGTFASAAPSGRGGGTLRPTLRGYPRPSPAAATTH
jgi:ribosome-associated translation inhibitor RaiA